jgi:stathmin
MEGDTTNSKNTTEKHGGVAFEVILKPASGDAPDIHASSPTRERPLSQEDIERKLKEAEEKRLSLQASKLHIVEKDKERIQEASQKVQELSDSFSKETEKKLAEKMEASQEIINAQMQARQERLKEHERHAEEVRKKKLSMSDETAAADGDGC